MLRTYRQQRRHGIAAVELAIVLPFLLVLLLGLWEVGRVVMVHNVMTNAAYEGGRLAATGGFFSSTNYNDPTSGQQMTLQYSQDSSGNPIPYDVQKRVLVYLQASGLSTNGVTVTVTNVAQNWSGTYTGGSSPSGSSSGSNDPAAAATQLDHLQVTVQVPYTSIRWSTLGPFIPSTTTLSATVDWYSLRNAPVTVPTTLPQQPSS
jgi:Flp pilus assembly protein TadG